MPYSFAAVDFFCSKHKLLHRIEIMGRELFDSYPNEGTLINYNTLYIGLG